MEVNVTFSYLAKEILKNISCIGVVLCGPCMVDASDHVLSELACASASIELCIVALFYTRITLVLRAHCEILSLSLCCNHLSLSCGVTYTLLYHCIILSLSLRCHHSM